MEPLPNEKREFLIHISVLFVFRLILPFVFKDNDDMSISNIKKLDTIVKNVRKIYHKLKTLYLFNNWPILISYHLYDKNLG